MRDFDAEAVAELDAEFGGVNLAEWRQSVRDTTALRWGLVSLAFLAWAVMESSGLVLLASAAAFVPFGLNADSRAPY